MVGWAHIYTNPSYKNMLGQAKIIFHSPLQCAHFQIPVLLFTGVICLTKLVVVVVFTSSLDIGHKTVMVLLYPLYPSLLSARDTGGR